MAKGAPLKLCAADVIPLDPQVIKALAVHYFSLEFLQEVWADISSTANDDSTGRVATATLPIIGDAKGQLPIHSTLMKYYVRSGFTPTAAQDVKLRCTFCGVSIDRKIDACPRGAAHTFPFVPLGVSNTWAKSGSLHRDEKVNICQQQTEILTNHVACRKRHPVLQG